jgi:hypothetical protein
VPDPERQRPLVAASGYPGVESGRQHDLITPGLALAPASLVQEVGGRRERIGDTVHEVSLAVSVAIDGQPQEGRGHELGMAKSSGPGADQAILRDVAAVENFQRAEKLAPKIGLPAPEAGECAERGEQRPLAEVAPEVAFDAPDGEHRVLIDLVAFGRGGKWAEPLLAHGECIGDAFVIDERPGNPRSASGTRADSRGTRGRSGQAPGRFVKRSKDAADRDAFGRGFGTQRAHAAMKSGRPEPPVVRRRPRRRSGAGTGTGRGRRRFHGWGLTGKGLANDLAGNHRRGPTRRWLAGTLESAIAVRRRRAPSKHVSCRVAGCRRRAARLVFGVADDLSPSIT